ncbi:hypothetical protein MPH_06511 [Macrophomina phaseolina MS6]|uniref:Hydroxymethylglutaryl-CoA synthase n=1 Tax=Macrophomina phaseolina (strain MS6) TaxID=1126212 RepID=K2RU75_MACPH|nr:hypothetical protein MPH_06511 [Macrophomina phaseolina MS6]
MAARPPHVGIKALEIYFPSQCVGQAELEKFQGVSAGKYTIGLAQTKMSFCDDREGQPRRPRIRATRPLTRARPLLACAHHRRVAPAQLFEEHGNYDIEGVDTYNACYGGTNALFNAVNWVESSAWDGRDAIVVAGDIALYEKPAARPTGGAGCVAMLVGPDAPLVLEPGMRGSFMRHTYDFYKANMKSEYPLVDGHFSIKCYVEAVDACYKNYQKRLAKLAFHDANGTSGANGPRLFIDHFDYFAFHAPTCKLVSKSYGRLLYNDFLANPTHPAFESVPADLREMDYQSSLGDKALEKTFIGLTKKRFAERVFPSIEAPTMCGNMYTASVYASLVSLVSNIPSDTLQGKRIGIFSYGSGLASSLFSIRVRGDVAAFASKIDLHRRLDNRITTSAETYDEMCKLRERAYQQKNYTPVGDVNLLVKGTYYLAHVDDMFQRTYKVKG